MAFVETRFPTDISFGSAGGPEYSTDIVLTQGGYEQRNRNWSQARARYNVAYGIRTAAQLGAVIAFFRARRGRADGFRFKDWSDYQMTASQIGTGDGSTTSFQLVKHYASGTIFESRIITKPVAETLTVYFDDVAQSSSIYQVSSINGLITFDSAPAGGVVITATCEFDVPVRFDTDRLSTSLDSYGIGSVSDVPLVEVRI